MLNYCLLSLYQRPSADPGPAVFPRRDCCLHRHNATAWEHSSPCFPHGEGKLKAFQNCFLQPPDCRWGRVLALRPSVTFLLLVTAPEATQGLGKGKAPRHHSRSNAAPQHLSACMTCSCAISASCRLAPAMLLQLKRHLAVPSWQHVPGLLPMVGSSHVSE